MSLPKALYLSEERSGYNTNVFGSFDKKYYSEDLIEEIIKQLKTRKKEVNETVGFGIEEALWVIEEVLKDE